MALVAFLDILGSTEMVKKEKFTDIQILDFANAVGIMAKFNLKVRFAVFSDSVIISCSEDLIRNFVSVLSFLYSQWFSDHIFVRGGIAIGDIRWVEHPPSDELFQSLSNFTYSRVYGKALVEAYKIEQKSGPGAICFVSEDASSLFRKTNNYILDGLTNMLIWTHKEGVEHWCKMFNFLLKNEIEDMELRRHLLATLRYFQSLKNFGKDLPSSFDYDFREHATSNQ
ncbi:MAG: hypothetical protein LWW94_07060 [Candidatus Desulfofervidaceae bacterium]|nr:hypothetical protein [Candidatus Desulfofervidaceae bacterium]